MNQARLARLTRRLRFHHGPEEIAEGWQAAIDGKRRIFLVVYHRGHRAALRRWGTGLDRMFRKEYYDYSAWFCRTASKWKVWEGLPEPAGFLSKREWLERRMNDELRADHEQWARSYLQR